MQRTVTALLHMGAIALAYFLAAETGLRLALVNDSSSAIWPASGLAVAALVLWGWRVWPGVAVGAFAANALNLVPTMGWAGALVALAIAVGNTLEAVAAGVLTTRWVGGRDGLHQPVGVARFMAASFLAPLAAASVGVAVLLAWSQLPLAGAGPVWLTWYLGDVGGILVVTPVIVLARPWQGGRGRTAEAVALTASMFLVAAVWLKLPAGAPFAFLAAGPIMWAAWRFGPSGTALATAVTAAFALPLTLAGRGPFGAQDPNTALLMLQVFVATCSVLGLGMAALVDSRNRLQTTLELQVTQRTALLQESMSRFQILAEASPVGIFHIARDGSVDYANQRWMEISGCQDTGQETIQKAVHPEDWPALMQAWTTVFSAGDDLVAEFRYVHQDARVRFCRTRASPLRDAEGQLTGYVGVLEDITDVRAARAKDLEVSQLREQADFKTNFLRTAAHELGNPLTPIRIQMRLLNTGLKDASPDTRKSMQILDRNVNRLQVLVQDMLESARLQSGRLKLGLKATDLAHLVHDVVETFQEQAIQNGIILDTSGPHELPVTCDPDRITQVLYNLVSNAMKFTPSGGRIHIDLRRGGTTALLEVADTGSGLTADQISRLFRPFAQVHEGAHTGSGLGLYISRGIVEQHGGTLLCQSPGAGRGCTFSVTVPLEVSAEATAGVGSETVDVPTRATPAAPAPRKFS